MRRAFRFSWVGRHRSSDTSRLDAAQLTARAAIRPHSRWRSVLLAAPLLVIAEQFPVSELTVRAAALPDSQGVHGTIGTSVATPIGRLPVTGRATVAYSCDGTFTGTVRYSWLVRLGARIKGVGLVSALDGQLPPAALTECTLPVESLTAHLRIIDSTIAGHLLSGGDSAAIAGTLRADGDTAYHAAVLQEGGTFLDSAFVAFRVR